MSEELFDVVFFGILQAGKDKETVMQNMAKLFKTEAQKLTPYFAGGRKVIKGKINASVAKKYKAALENVGLVIKLEAHQASTAAEKPVAAKATASQSTPASQADSENTGISIADVGADVLEHPVEVVAQEIGDISDISMADVGADVLKNPVEAKVQEIVDISDISMAEAGADILTTPVEIAAQKIDEITDVTLAETGSDLLDHHKQVTPQEIEDISDISIAEVGADVIANPKPKEKTVIPDISELSLGEKK